MSSAALRLTADIQDVRKALHLLLKDRYGHAIKPTRELLRRVVAEQKVPLAQAALMLAKRANELDCDPNLIFAAFADEAEGVPE